MAGTGQVTQQPQQQQPQGTDLGAYGGGEIYGTPTTGTAGSTTYQLGQFGGINAGYDPAHGWDANYYGTTPQQDHATNWFPSLQAALQAAGAPQLPGSIPQNLGTGAANAPNGSALSQILNGGYNPLQPTYLQAPPQQLATMFGGAQSNAQTGLSQDFLNSLSPNSTIGQILQGFMPQAAQSTRALNDQLAAMGVYGGNAADAQTKLQGQLTSSLAPSLAAAIQNSQGNLLNANEFGSSQGLQQALANAGWQQQAGLSNQGAQNAANAANVGNWIGYQTGNTNLANQGGQNLWAALNGAYGQDYNAFNNINTMGLSGAQGLASSGLYGGQNLAGSIANNFPIQSGAASSYGALGSALGGAFNQPSSQPGFGPYYDGANPQSAFGYNYNPFTNYTLPGAG